MTYQNYTTVHIKQKTQTMFHHNISKLCEILKGGGALLANIIQCELRFQNLTFNFLEIKNTP